MTEINTENLEEFGFYTVPPEKSVVCDTHGKYTSKNYFRNLWTQCPACVDTEKQRILVEAGEKERVERLRRWESKIGQAGIPDRFRDRTLESFVAHDEKQREALAFCKHYAGSFDDVLAKGRCAVFVGRPGTGKTHLAVGIGLEIMRRDNRAVLFTTVMRAIRRVKNTWSRNSEESEQDAIAALTFPDLLILDEVGIQFGSETEKLIIFDVLNERYEKRLPTIMLSNLSLDEVRAYMGERIFDRMKEDGGQVIPFGWDSYRGRGDLDAKESKPVRKGFS